MSIFNAASARQKALRNQIAWDKEPGESITPEVEKPLIKGYSRVWEGAPGIAEPGAGPEAKAPVKAGGRWKGMLGSALQGAAYGIQANVGPAIPGQEFRQGLLRGVVGTGMAAAATERNKAARDLRDLSLRDKLEYLEAKDKNEPSWEEKFNLTEAGKMKRLKEEIAGRGTLADIKEGMSEKDIAELNFKIREAIARDPRFKYRNPTPDEERNMYIDLKKNVFAGRKIPVPLTEIAGPPPPKK